MLTEQPNVHDDDDDRDDSNKEDDTGFGLIIERLPWPDDGDDSD